MGVTIERLVPGDGLNFPKKDNTVVIHCKLRITLPVPVLSLIVTRLDNGDKFDSSRDRGKPFVTKIGNGVVIKGWDEGVPQLSLGEKAILKITPDYGYGARGAPPVIPPNANLTFEVELLEIHEN
ncbi:hypothetical protein KVV02_008253 [Mortierella alpina]|uniref:peptidylprolyl isomerase n=1 Tax=Mortierella alpina TaxID=64518 RepID=A0A9P8A591_MORAP|nr:hypothetical protein KVV02_008253 [Mortierella alpina]